MKVQRYYIFSLVIRCLLILLFTYTAVSKWLSYDALLYQLQQSPFIPGGYRFLSFSLPGIELIISVGLAIPFTARYALSACVVLLSVFTIYILCMLLFAAEVPCSCGGFISLLSWPQHIGFNIIATFLCLWAYHHSEHAEEQTIQAI